MVADHHDPTPVKRKSRWRVGLLTVLALLIGLVVVARFGVILPQGRHLVEQALNGRQLGRLGRLQIRGLHGDVWSNFSVDHLTISDSRGMWLEARSMTVSWHSLYVVGCRLQIDRLGVGHLTVLRRPILGPRKPQQPNPISVRIGRLTARVELAPAFSYRRGLFDLDGNIFIARRGGPIAEIKAYSLLHVGDHAHLRVNLSDARHLVIKADVVEAKGGAIAGVLGLPADLPFLVDADVGGTGTKGIIKVVATSGAEQPVEVTGGWTPAGGTAAGRVSLTASSLTKGLAARLGPEARIQAAAWRGTGGLYEIAARAKADNLTLSANGLGDLAKWETGPLGLKVVAETPSLVGLIGGPEMGKTTLSGQLRGGQKAGRWTGQGEVAGLALETYQLSHVSGPLEIGWQKRQLDLRGTLLGVGGRGSGYLAALLGAVPSVRFEGSRLADGRLVLKDILANGLGLMVQASGGRSLLGGLTLDGRATVSNLQRAHQGVAGRLSATWRAVQPGLEKPWTVTSSIAGEGLSTGYGQLDRLIGASPKLEINGEVLGRQISIIRASLVGPMLQATSAGIIASDGRLGLDLNWTAQGPFEFGPLVVTGKARGTGGINGTVTQPHADLLADFEAVDLPRLPLKDAHLVMTFDRTPHAIGGGFVLNATSAYGPALAKAMFGAPAGGLELRDLSVAVAGLSGEGSLSLRSQGRSRADLKIAVSKGAFLDDGSVSGSLKVEDGLNGPVAHINLLARNAVLPGQKLEIGAARLLADGPISRLPYTVEANGATTADQWSLSGHGTIKEKDPNWIADFTGAGKYGRRVLRTSEAGMFVLGRGEQSARLRLVAADGGQIAVDGHLAGRSALVDAQIEKLDMTMVDQDLVGRVDAALHLQGDGSQLSGTLSVDLEGVRGKGADISEGLGGTLRGRLQGADLSIDTVLTNGQGLRARGSFVLPAEASASPFRVAINRRKPLKGEVFADGEVKPLWDLLVGGQRELAGRVKLQGVLAGTLDDLRAVGDASVTAGRFSDATSGLVLQDVNLKVDLADNVVNLSEVRGADGHGGTVEGEGRVSLVRAGVSTFALDLRGFRLIDNDLGTASASGKVTLDRKADGKVRIAGNLNVDRADIAARTPTPSGVTPMDVTEINRPVELGGSLRTVARPADSGIALDVGLKAPRRIFLRGRGLDVELSLDAHVGGSTANPRLSGNARVVRGDYDFAGKRFVFDERGIVYLASSPSDIHLDLSATRDDPTLTAVVRIRGTAAKPEITLTSTPALPSDEVLSQVLFGRSAAQLSPLEAAQLASTLSSLAGGGGFDVIGNLKTFAGLDRLALGGGGQTGVTVSGGKYLTDDVYLELTGGGRDGTAAQVEWRIGKSLSIISKIAGQGDGKLAVRWRRDY